MATVGELAPLFARREPLLEHLYEGVHSKADLVEQLSISRSTVDRSVRELASAGVLERRDHGYGFTLMGRLLYEEYRSFANHGSEILAAKELLEALPPETTLPPETVAEATITTPGRTEPYRPFERHLELVKEATEVDLLATAIAPQIITAYHERVLAGDLRMRVGMTSEVTERLIAEYATETAAMIDTGRVDLRELSESPPFSFTRVETPDEEYLTLLVYGPDGLRGHLLNKTDEATAFARELFEQYWEETTPMSMVTELPT